nr:GNAT family N-acetyltransferase [uncultured Akkermansia sp.]
MEDRDSLLLEQLLNVWENSVRATHFFLAEADMEDIKKYVPQALRDISHLIVAENGQGVPAAFMGIEGQKLEMLFISPEETGRGLGRKLLQYGMQNFAINTLGVNEQNPQAKGFYEHMGFQVYKRTDHDEQANPYPVLYMRLV